MGWACLLSALFPMFSPATALLPQRNRCSGSFSRKAKDKKTCLFTSAFVALQPASALALVSTMAPVTVRQGSVCAGQDLKGTPVTSVLQATSTTLCASVSILHKPGW